MASSGKGTFFFLVDLEFYQLIPQLRPAACRRAAIAALTAHTCHIPSKPHYRYG
jgi:hypothetical protein